MEPADRNSAAKRTSRSARVAALVVVVVLGSSLLVWSTPAVDPAIAVGILVALFGFAIVIRWRGSTAASDDGEDDESTTVWNAIPSWQYGGRHVESGGIARGEQERALQDIQQQADELADEPADE